MFLKVSDEKCLTTKGLTKIEYNKTDKTIVFSYENERKEQVFLDCPLYRCRQQRNLRSYRRQTLG